MSEELFKKMAQSVIDGDNETAEELARQALKAGVEPLDAINHGYAAGMDTVGALFASGEYFLPDLILGGEAMKAALAVLEPALKAAGQHRAVLGTVVLGSVKGDIHEIGKSLVATMLSANGFAVHDLGVDVSVERFLAAVREHSANLVGMSALLTTTMSNQRKVIDALEAEGLRDSVKVMVGGAPVTEQWARDIGADGYAEDAIGAVVLAKTLVK